MLRIFLLFTFITIISGNNGTVQFSKRNLRNGIATTYQVFENACQYPIENYNNFLRVAVSGEEWNNGEKCGSCLEIIGTGNGIGTEPFVGKHKAIITNMCPECPPGHFDLYQAGNGIWDINYEYVACENLGPIQYRVENNNLYYLQLQFINTGQPITYCSCNGENMEKTFDNFWVHYNPTEIVNNTNIVYPVYIECNLENGEIISGNIYENYDYTNL